MQAIFPPALGWRCRYPHAKCITSGVVVVVFWCKMAEGIHGGGGSCRFICFFTVILTTGLAL